MNWGERGAACRLRLDSFTKVRSRLNVIIRHCWGGVERRGEARGVNGWGEGGRQGGREGGREGDEGVNGWEAAGCQ